MSSHAELPRFEWRDVAAKAFLDTHGFVIVSGVIAPAHRDVIRTSWAAVVGDAAARVQMDTAEFTRRFPQNRDLWRKHDGFRRVLFESSQADAAMRFLGTSGVRLFHDHAIAKPSRASGTIPWHQDSSYWPLDRPGLSLWTPMDDVSAAGGCLKVLAGSHLDGPAPPRDFLAASVGQASFDKDPRLRVLPARVGETVILHGLTWHASDPNTSDVDRLAYLTLWVPATARVVPDHAKWHPSAGHVTVAAGERLDGEWFPLFGRVATEDDRGVVSFPAPPPAAGPSMFTAGKDIAEQIAWLLKRPSAPLEQLLESVDADALTAAALAARVIEVGAEAEFREILADLLMHERVRRESVARDVYLGTVGHWWQLAGTRIDEARHAS